VLAKKHPLRGSARSRWHLINEARTAAGPQDFDREFFSSVAWKNETHIWTTSVNGTLSEYEVASGKRKTVWESKQALDFVRFNATHDLALAIEASGRVSLFKPNGELVKSHEFGQAVSCVAFSEQLDAWILGGYEGSLRIFSADFKPLASLELGNQIHDARMWSVGGEINLFCIAGDGAVLRYSVDQGEQIKFVKIADLDMPDRNASCNFRQVVVNEKLDQVAAVDTEGKISLWSLSKSQLQLSFSRLARRGYGAPNIEQRRALDPLEARTRWFLDGRGMQTFAIDSVGTLRRFDLSKITDPVVWKSLQTQLGEGARLAHFHGHSDRVWSLNSRGKLMLVSLSKDSVLAEVEQAHRGGIVDIHVLGNGDIVTAGNDKFLKVWRFVSGSIRELRSIEAEQNLLSVAVEESKDLAASVDETGKLNVWKWSSGKQLHRLAFHDEEAPQNDEKDRPVKVLTGQVAFSKTGKYLAAAGSWQEFAVFDTASFEKVALRRISNAGDGALAIAFSPGVENRFMLSDTLVRLSQLCGECDEVFQF